MCIGTEEEAIVVFLLEITGEILLTRLGEPAPVGDNIALEYDEDNSRK